MNAGALDNTGNNSYTHSHGHVLRDQDQSINSVDLRDQTEGEAFIELSYNVSAHYSNNNNRNAYIYGDPSYLSTEDECLIEEDEQALQEAFVVIPTAKTVRIMISDLDPIAMVKVKTMNKIQVDRSLVCLLDTGSTDTMI